MTRAGREPAEDVKRKLIAACRELGLDRVSARMTLMPAMNLRLVYVDAAPADWPSETPLVGLIASVATNGDCTGVRIIPASADDTSTAGLSGPFMKGRDRVPFVDVVEEVRATLAERQEVVAAVRSGRRGPFRFDYSVWE